MKMSRIITNDSCINCGARVRNDRSSLCQPCFDKALSKKIREIA